MAETMEELNKLGFVSGQKYDIAHIVGTGADLYGFDANVEKYNLNGITYVFERTDEAGRLSFREAVKSNVEIRAK